MGFEPLTKREIMERNWVKPSQSDSVHAWQEAISKMMDEWAKVVSETTIVKSNTNEHSRTIQENRD